MSKKSKKQKQEPQRSNQRDWVEFTLGDDGRIYARGNHPDDILDLLIQRINNPRDEIQRMSNKILGEKKRIRLEIKLLNINYDDRFGYINDTTTGSQPNFTQRGGIILGVSDSNGRISERKIGIKRI